MLNKKKLKPYIPLILSLLLAVILFFIVEDFVKTVIVKPFLYVIWFFSLILQSIPQEAIWVGFIVLMLLFSYFSLVKEKASRSSARTLPLSRKLSPIEKWSRLFENAQISHLSKWRLSKELKLLTQDILTSNLNPENQNNSLSDSDLPEEIIEFFETRQPSSSQIHALPGETATALDLDPEVVVQYLEKRLRS